MSFPDDFLAGFLGGVFFGVVLMGFMAWGLDGLENRRQRRRDLRYVSPPTRRGTHETPPS